MEVAKKHIDAGYKTAKVLKTCNLSPSQWYYKPVDNPSRAGRRASKMTLCDGLWVDENQVIADMKELFSGEFVDYGYLKTTAWLKSEKGYQINKKKVYRIMKDNRFLLRRRGASKTHRKWVKELVPQPDEPFAYLEFDIKDIFIHGQQRNAKLLTILDVLTRFNLGHILQFSVKKHDVAALFRYIKDTFPLADGVTVRSDNGSQFISHLVRETLEELTINHEFTLPATPEQNAHIEAYHSVLQSAVCKRQEFINLKEAKATMDRFREFYNFKRLHSALGYRPPISLLKEFGFFISPQDLCFKTQS
jgi:transposase InsO family protein